MTKDRNNLADDDTGKAAAGWMSNLLAEEDEIDRRVLWRLGSWGAGAVAILVVAILAARSPNLQRNQTAAADLARQSQQIQWIAKESQNEARRLAAAVDTLNTDRDRLYSRLTTLEQNLDSVTGSISRQATAPAPPLMPSPVSSTGPSADQPEASKAEQAAPAAAPTASAPSATAASLKPEPPADQSGPALPAPPAAATTPTADVAAAAPSAALAEKPVQPAAFGVDLGGANSVDGLRALWRGALKSNKQVLEPLRPLIVVKERSNGLGMQLRLVAGPIGDAAEVAKICAKLTLGERTCETSIYDGQRLALNDDKRPTDPPAADPAVPKKKKRSQAAVEDPGPPPRGSLSSIFSFR